MPRELLHISWRVDWKQQQEISRIFEVTENARSRTRELWGNRLIPMIRRQIHDHFARERGPIGTWQRLSPEYSAWKESRFPGQGILQLRHRLISAATQTGAYGNITEITDKYVEFGIDLTKIPYARVHDLGGQAGRGRSSRMPKREYLFLSKKDQDDIAQEAARFIWDEGLSARGGGGTATAPLGGLAGLRSSL